MENLCSYTLLSIIEMIDIRIEKLVKEYEDKGIRFEMPLVTEAHNLKRELVELYYKQGE
jgi:hypothetical protein